MTAILCNPKRHVKHFVDFQNCMTVFSSCVPTVYGCVTPNCNTKREFTYKHPGINLLAEQQGILLYMYINENVHDMI